jgi:outer membrane lipoprotein SlyB
MFKAGSIWAGVLSGAISQFEDTRAMTSGQMNKKEYAVNTSKNITGGIGVMAGIEYGSILGTSLLPGAGTIIGAILGSMIGSRIGNYTGSQVGQVLFKHSFDSYALQHEEKLKLNT